MWDGALGVVLKETDGMRNVRAPSLIGWRKIEHTKYHHIYKMVSRLKTARRDGVVTACVRSV